MAITIKGAFVTTITIAHDDKQGPGVTGSYSLMSSNNTVLAKQTFNGYSDVKVPLSNETRERLAKFEVSLQTDVNIALGIV